METVVGQRLKIVRNRLGKTQIELALAIGVAHSTISRAENGSEISAEALATLCSVFPEVNADYLLRGSGEPVVQIRTAGDGQRLNESADAVGGYRVMATYGGEGATTATELLAAQREAAALRQTVEALQRTVETQQRLIQLLERPQS